MINISVSNDISISNWLKGGIGVETFILKSLALLQKLADYSTSS